MLKNIFLLPIKLCARCLYKISDLFISAMRMSALNWQKIGRRAADASMDVAESGKKHIKELRGRKQGEK
jgi:hypothetical protein